MATHTDWKITYITPVGTAPADAWVLISQAGNNAFFQLSPSPLESPAPGVVFEGWYYSSDFLEGTLCDGSSFCLNDYGIEQVSPQPIYAKWSGLSKIIYKDETILDLSAATLTSDNLLEGYVAYDKNGLPIKGTLLRAEGGSF